MTELSVHPEHLFDEYQDATWVRADLADSEQAAREYAAQEMHLGADEIGELQGDGPTPVVQRTVPECLCGEGCGPSECIAYYPVGQQPGGDKDIEPDTSYWRFAP